MHRDDLTVAALSAAQFGDDEALATYLRQGLNPELSEDINRRTLLMLASSHGQIGIVQRLIVSGANLNATCRRGATALSISARKGHMAIAQLLLEAGADPNGKSIMNSSDHHDSMGIAVEEHRHSAFGAFGFGIRPLHEAASQGNTLMAELLLMFGANPDVQHLGRTPLRLAIEEGHVSIVELLLRSGANPDIEGPDGLNSLMTASIHSSSAIVIAELIKFTSDINKKVSLDFNNSQRTSLHMASIYGNETALLILIENGADLNAQDDRECTPLDLAIINGRETIARILSGSGGRRAAAGPSLLHEAARRGDVSEIRRLISRGYDVDAKEKVVSGEPRRTALMLASTNGHYDAAKTLIDLSANINIKTFDNPYCDVTALVYAVQNGYAEIVKLLVQAGANPRSTVTDIDTGEDESVIQIAERLGSKKIIELLSKY